MSQQEMVPESQSDQQYPSSDDEVYSPGQPYYWATKPVKQDVPRDESPLDYDESLLEQNDDQSYGEQNYQEGYRAQDPPANSVGSASTANTKQQSSTVETNTGRQSLLQQQQFSSDGDAFEQGYRPYRGYNTWQGVPPWARAQRRRRGAAGIIMLILAGIFLIKPLLALLAFLFAAIGIAAVAFVLVIVFLVFLLPIIALLAAVARGAGWSGRQRWRYFNYWRRPGPWRWWW